MNTKSATFIGHSSCYGISASELEAQIERLILEGTKIFLCGGMGHFDIICAAAVHRFKLKYSDIRLILVIPYLSFRITMPELYDEIIYPEGFERYHFKSAIIKRNEYMVDNSDTAVCYVDHSYGGAYKTFEYAKKQGIRIINLGSL